MVRLLTDKHEVIEVPRVTGTIDLMCGKYNQDTLVSVGLYIDDPEPRQIMTVREAEAHYKKPTSERYSPGMVDRTEEDHCGGYC